MWDISTRESNFSFKPKARTRLGRNLNKYYSFWRKKDIFLKFFIVMLSFCAMCASLIYSYGMLPLAGITKAVGWFNYFTNLSLVYVFVWYLLNTSATLLRNKALCEWLDRIPVKGTMVFMESLTGIIFMTVLVGPLLYGQISDRFETANWTLFWIIQFTVHFLIPVFVWTEFRTALYIEPKGDRKNFYIATWIILSIYLTWQLIRVNFYQNAPYPFLDYYNYPNIVAFGLPLVFIFTVFFSFYIEKRFTNNIKFFVKKR